MELHEVPTRIALVDHDGWDLHDAKLTGLDEKGAVAEVHFDLPHQCLDRPVFLEVQLDDESFVALCEYVVPKRADPGALHLEFVDPIEVHHGAFGELIDLHKPA